VYRNLRYTLDLGHPLQLPCEGSPDSRLLYLSSKYLVSPPWPWEMYGPPSDCKLNLCGECFGSAQLYQACLWSFRSWP
jgi:hypothetical protein